MSCDIPLPSSSPSSHTAHSSHTWIRGCRSLIVFVFQQDHFYYKPLDRRDLWQFCRFISIRMLAVIKQIYFISGGTPLSNAGRDKCHPKWGFSWFSPILESSPGMTSYVLSRPHLSISVAYPGIFFRRGGFNKFSWGQRTERTGIWGR